MDNLKSKHCICSFKSKDPDSIGTVTAVNLENVSENSQFPAPYNGSNSTEYS